MSQPRRESVGSARQAEDLAADLDQMAAAIDQARAIGLSVAVPDALYRACVKIIARYGDGTGSGNVPTPSSALSTDLDDKGRSSGSRIPGAPVRRSAMSPSLDDVPLRRLVWQVIDPGSEFTVSHVVHRLGELGMVVPSNKVSNALGYWASRGRLVRARKGSYRYAIEADHFEAGQIKPFEIESVDVNAPRHGKEEHANHAESPQRKAM